MLNILCKSQPKKVDTLILGKMDFKTRNVIRGLFHNDTSINPKGR